MNSVLPYTTIAEAIIPGGKRMVLQRDGSWYFLFVDDVMLMSSRHHFSEEELSRLALETLPPSDAPSVMIGGLGMGYTLRSALDLLPPGASASVIELASAVVDWNRGHLGELANHPLNDPRVTVEIDSVEAVVSRKEAQYDCILLDLDNGAEALTLETNDYLYTLNGLREVRKCLRRNGVLGIWFIRCDDAFVERMKDAGFQVSRHLIDAGEGDPPHDTHTILIGRAVE